MPAAMEATEPPSKAAAGAWVLSVKCRLEEAGVSETRLLLLRRAHLDELHCKLGWLFNLQGRYQLKYLDKFGDLITFSSDEEFQLALSNFLPPEFRILITPAAGEPTTRSTRKQWTSRPLPPPSSKAAAAPTVAPSAPASAASEATAVPINNRVAAMSDDASVLSAAERPSVRQNRKPAAAVSDNRLIFHPDYLRPRIATQRKSASTAPGVQASLAGYRQDVAVKGSDGADFVHFGIGCSRCGADPLIGWRFKCSLCPNYNMCVGCFDNYSHGHGFYRLP